MLVNPSYFENNIGHQSFFPPEPPLVPALRLPAPPNVGQYRLNLSQLDSKTADLYLLVDTAKKLDVAVGQIPNQIAGLVKSSPRLITERMRNKFLCREFRADSDSHALNRRRRCKARPSRRPARVEDENPADRSLMLAMGLPMGYCALSPEIA